MLHRQGAHPLLSFPEISKGLSRRPTKNVTMCTNHTKLHHNHSSNEQLVAT
jgi:hypothetical protein